MSGPRGIEGRCKFCGRVATSYVDLSVDHGVRWGVCDRDECAEKSDAEVERITYGDKP